jgi:hypothetical protein
MGFSDFRILVVHIFPNILGDLMVMGSIWMATAVRTEAALSFIGLGVNPPTATLGGMIREGFKDILSAPWASLFPGSGYPLDCVFRESAWETVCVMLLTQNYEMKSERDGHGICTGSKEFEHCLQTAVWMVSRHL